MSRSHSGVLEAVDRIVNRGGEPDEVLTDVLRALHERGFRRVEIAFRAGGRMVVGPAAGSGEATRTFEVALAGEAVGELRVAGAEPDDGPVLERVATLISPYVRAGSRADGDTSPT